MRVKLNRSKAKKGSEWLDWLSDDPTPAGLRARMRSNRVQEASTHTPRSPKPVKPAAHHEEGVKKIQVQITVPKFKRPKLPAKLTAKLASKRFRIGASAVVLVVVVAGVASQTILSSGTKDDGSKGVLSTQDQKPDFTTLLPDGKESNTVSGDVAYDAQRKVTSYTDTIMGQNVTVSQQPLPEDFKDNPDEKVKKLAEGFSATDVISTSTPKAYLGTSIKGPQTVIFTKNGLLIFILSNSKIDKHDWAEYITKLK
jgi:hypothetical protein